MSPHDIYLETQVATATPQRLRLMLIEGAIRRARLTIEHWREGRDDLALESLITCRGMVSELLAGVRDEQSDLGKNVVGLYVFLFQTLTAAQLSRNPAALAPALFVLEEERQTWSQVCQQLADLPHASRAAADEETAPSRLDGLLASNPMGCSAPASAGLSLEA
jgi:flagellar protein FliS